MHAVGASRRDDARRSTTTPSPNCERRPSLWCPWPRLPTVEKKVPGPVHVIFYGILDDHRYGAGKALVQFEDEAIIKLAPPGGSITSVRDHIFGVERHRARAELGERAPQDLVLAGDRVVGDKVGRVEHNTNEPCISAQLVEQTPPGGRVGDDVARLRLDPEAHVGAFGGGQQLVERPPQVPPRIFAAIVRMKAPRVVGVAGARAQGNGFDAERRRPADEAFRPRRGFLALFRVRVDDVICGR